MISSLKTPGVYVFEQDAFPPSVAQVETAIPAFIGFTEKQPSIDPQKPTLVKSLLEFQNKFGGAPNPEGITIDVAANDYKVIASKFKMYNSLELFYQNGGGKCYIVSTGTYKRPNGTQNSIQKDDFYKAAPPQGIKLLEKVDEITLILFPDAVNLNTSDLGNIQQQALMQCADLMDRFTILDVIQTPSAGIDTDMKSFRDSIGSQNLKYGAAYYPYLKSGVPYNFSLKLIDDNGGNFETRYANDDSIVASMQDYTSVYEDVNNVNGILADWVIVQDNNKKVDINNDETKVKDYLASIWGLMGKLADTGTEIQNVGLRNFVDGMIPIALKPNAQNLIEFNMTYASLTGTTAADIGALNGVHIGVWGDFTSNANTGDYPSNVATSSYKGQLNQTADATIPDFNKIQSHLDKLFDQVVDSMQSVVNSVKEYLSTLENNVASSLPIYPTILAGLSKAMNNTPPSGAIAGVYANVDFTRGVWKAPANVTIAGIDGFTVDINDKDQESMNIHETGKSVNALRAFTGRGKYVWGARTLDGNSNDWRYINVRRLAIMIEESAKKACFNFVFEPNVKQTWVRVKGMIENFLNTLWRDGALAGAKPEHAFFVHVGLDLTMNQDDINNGRMIVKIGYAPSRPAEFILLVFKQKQQES